MKKYFSSYCPKHTTVWDPKVHPKYNSHIMYAKGIITDYLQNLGLSLHHFKIHPKLPTIMQNVETHI